MLKTATVVPEPFVLSTLPPSRAQKRLSLAIVLVMLATFFVASGLLSHVQFPEVAAFLPAYAMAIVLSDLLTAILLFSQFSIFRTRALLILSNGYLFTALMAVAWILTFPGAFGPKNLVGGLQSTPYLYSSWHAGFPLFVIGYTVLKDTDSRRQLGRDRVIGAIAFSVALTTAVVFAVAFFFIAGARFCRSCRVMSSISRRCGLTSGCPLHLWWFMH
jgi:hypothetical protein